MSEPQHATLLAGDDCELLALPRQRYAELLGSRPDVAVPDAVYRQLKVRPPWPALGVRRWHIGRLWYRPLSVRLEILEWSRLTAWVF